MRNPIPAEGRTALQLIVVSFCLGSAFQLGVSVVSQITPQVRVIEVRQASQAQPQDTAHRIEF